MHFFSLYGAKLETLACGLKIGHVNGGLFYFEPVPGVFKEIKAGQELVCLYKNHNWLVSRTDNFPNWYVAAPGLTSKNISNTVDQDLTYVKRFDTSAKWKRTKEDKYDPYTTAERFDIFKRGPSSRRNFKVVPTPKATTIEQDNAIQFVPREWAVTDSQDFKWECQWLAGNKTKYYNSM